MLNTSTPLLNRTRSILIVGGAFSSLRLFIGAISVIYLLQAGSLSISSISYLKSFQSILMILLSIYVGQLSDQYERKRLILIALGFCVTWLGLLYLGSYTHSLPIFYLSETCNTLSLLIMMNTYNAYLIDMYRQESLSKNYHWILGTYTQYSFPGIAVCAVLGAFLYPHLGNKIPLIPMCLLSLLFILACYYLPKQQQSHSPKQTLSKAKSRLLYRLIFKKITQHPELSIAFILVSAYYQVLIQYWQLIANYFSFFFKPQLSLRFTFLFYHDCSILCWSIRKIFKKQHRKNTYWARYL